MQVAALSVLQFRPNSFMKSQLENPDELLLERDFSLPDWLSEGFIELGSSEC